MKELGVCDVDMTDTTDPEQRGHPPRDCGNYHPLPCGLDKECPETDT